jgi:hypothetical protein
MNEDDKKDDDYIAPAENTKNSDIFNKSKLPNDPKKSTFMSLKNIISKYIERYNKTIGGIKRKTKKRITRKRKTKKRIARKRKTKKRN